MTGAAAEQLAAGVEAMVEAAFRGGDLDAVRQRLDAAREAAVAAGDRRVEAAAIDRLGMLMHFQALAAGRDPSNADAEEALFRQALAIRRELDDRGGIAESLFGIALVHQVLRRDRAAAWPYLSEALPLADAYGDLITRSEVHRHVGFHWLFEGGRPDTGRDYLRSSLDLRERYADPRWTFSGLLALGRAEVETGDPAAGIALLRRAVELGRAEHIVPTRVDQAADWLHRAEAGEPLPG